MGGDPNYIRGQMHLSRTVPGHLPPVPNQKDTALDSDDEDPWGDRVAPGVTKVGGDRGGGTGVGSNGANRGGAAIVLESVPLTTHREER